MWLEAHSGQVLGLFLQILLGRDEEQQYQMMSFILLKTQLKDAEVSDEALVQGRTSCSGFPCNFVTY